MNEQDELDEILIRLINGAQVEYKPSTRQRRRTEAKQAIKSFISKNYISKDKVIEAIGKDVYAPNDVGRGENNFRAEIKSNLGL